MRPNIGSTAFIQLSPPVSGQLILTRGQKKLNTSIQVVGVGPSSFLCKDFAFKTLKNNEALYLSLHEFSQKAIRIQPVKSKVNNSKTLTFDIASQDRSLWTDFLHRLRKDQHIHIAATQDIEASHKTNGLHYFSLQPRAYADFSFDEIDTSRSFLGKKFSYPIFITGMTGGVTQAQMINERLAAIATQYNIPMGIGSQRMALENEKFAKIFQLKDKYKNLFLIANLGLAQIVQAEDPVAYAQKAVDMIDANALAIHLNMLQELIQVEGDRNFGGFYKKLEQICAKISVPIIVKEVGCGFDKETVKQLLRCGIKVLDIGGAGGTSWSSIEGKRSQDKITQRLGELFRDWGEPTALNLLKLKKEFPYLIMTATGGMRSGLDVAKSVALDAHMVGFGLPLFKAALQSEEKLKEEIEFICRGLKIAMMCSGSQSLDILKERIEIHVNQ